MSWDVVLFNSSEKITSVEDIDESKLIPTDFDLVFEHSFENIIKKANQREIKGDDFAICWFCDKEPTSNTLLNLYGENALYQLIPLAIKNNWQIFDTGSGEMIDLNNPSKNGYENFQSYLNQILNKKDLQ